MKAMILAAGRGSRMGALTDHTSKVLLTIQGKSLIEYHLDNLINAGVSTVVINVWYQADKIKATVGDRYKNINIIYSPETELLGMGGGVYQALPLLGDEPFIVVSGDMWTRYSFNDLPKKLDKLAHIVLTDNPPHHPKGDFELKGDRVLPSGENNLNYGGVGMFKPDFFRAGGPGSYGISNVILPAIANQQVTGEYFNGLWANLNTPEDFIILEETLRAERI